MQLVLASSSPYRRELLTRLSVPFSWQPPEVDESMRLGESPSELAIRLSQEKAHALISAFPEHLIIGSDQVAVHNNELISKPYTHEKARQQLLRFSEQSVYFLSALCVHNSLLNTFTSAVVHTEVHFRKLGSDEIDRYLTHEQPYDCVGSFKAEGLGIALFSKITSDDPTAIIGLPMIKLCQMLSEHGYEIIDNIV